MPCITSTSSRKEASTRLLCCNTSCSDVVLLCPRFAVFDSIAGSHGGADVAREDAGILLLGEDFLEQGVSCFPRQGSPWQSGCCCSSKSASTESVSLLPVEGLQEEISLAKQLQDGGDRVMLFVDVVSALAPERQ